MVLTTGLAVWKSVTTMSGEQCVMISGAHLMLPLFAGSWDSLPLVFIFLFVYLFFVRLLAFCPADLLNDSICMYHCRCTCNIHWFH